MTGNELKLLLDWVFCGIDIACKCPFVHQNLNLYTFCKQQFDPKIKERQILHKSCCGVSVAREQQYNQDLKRIYKRDYEF